MNRADLISAIAELTGQPKTQVGETLTAVLHTITGSLSKGEKVTLVGFGTFERRQRQARTGRNPRTMDELKIPAARVPAFRPGLELKQIVDGEKKMPGFGVSGSSGKKTAKKPAKAAKPAAKSTAKKKR